MEKLQDTPTDQQGESVVKASDRRAFLQKDYELKIRYLSDHYTRMWSRCNFFVGLESAFTVALLGWFKDKGGFTPDAAFIAVIGAVLSFVWYCFGAQDRYLAEVYRKQVALLGGNLKRTYALHELDEKETRNYTHVGDTTSDDARVKMNFYQWRADQFSTTKLAVWFPVIAFVFWALMFLLIKGVFRKLFA